MVKQRNRRVEPSEKQVNKKDFEAFLEKRFKILKKIKRFNLLNYRYTAGLLRFNAGRTRAPRPYLVL